MGEVARSMFRHLLGYCCAIRTRISIWRGQMDKRTSLWSNTTVFSEWTNGIQKRSGRLSGWRPHTRRIVTTSPIVRLGTFTASSKDKTKNNMRRRLRLTILYSRVHLLLKETDSVVASSAIIASNFKNFLSHFDNKFFLFFVLLSNVKWKLYVTFIYSFCF